MNQDEQHLKVLSICHYVLGGIAAFFSSLFLVHVAVGIAVVSGRFDEWGPPAPRDMPPGFERLIGWLFLVVGSATVLFGWSLGTCLIVAGRKLARHRRRMLCLVIAAIECVMMPLGTILGVFTIMVLMRPTVIDLFGNGQPKPGALP